MIRNSLLGSAKPMEGLDQLKYQKHCFQLSWTQPCLPYLQEWKPHTLRHVSEKSCCFNLRQSRQFPLIKIYGRCPSFSPFSLPPTSYKASRLQGAACSPSRVIWEFPSTNPLLLRGPTVLAVTCQPSGAMFRGVFDALLWPWHMSFCTGLTAKGLPVVSSAASYFNDEPLVLPPKAVPATCLSS